MSSTEPYQYKMMFATDASVKILLNGQGNKAFNITTGPGKQLDENDVVAICSASENNDEVTASEMDATTLAQEFARKIRKTPKTTTFKVDLLIPHAALGVPSFAQSFLEELGRQGFKNVSVRAPNAISIPQTESASCEIKVNDTLPTHARARERELEQKIVQNRVRINTLRSPAWNKNRKLAIPAMKLSEYMDDTRARQLATAEVERELAQKGETLRRVAESGVSFQQRVQNKINLMKSRTVREQFGDSGSEFDALLAAELSQREAEIETKEAEIAAWEGELSQLQQNVRDQGRVSIRHMSQNLGEPIRLLEEKGYLVGGRTEKVEEKDTPEGPLTGSYQQVAPEERTPAENLRAYIQYLKEGNADKAPIMEFLNGLNIRDGISVEQAEYAKLMLKPLENYPFESDAHPQDIKICMSRVKSKIEDILKPKNISDLNKKITKDIDSPNKMVTLYDKHFKNPFCANYQDLITNKAPLIKALKEYKRDRQKGYVFNGRLAALAVVTFGIALIPLGFQRHRDTKISAVDKLIDQLETGRTTFDAVEGREAFTRSEIHALNNGQLSVIISDHVDNNPELKEVESQRDDAPYMLNPFR